MATPWLRLICAQRPTGLAPMAHQEAQTLPCMRQARSAWLPARPPHAPNSTFASPLMGLTLQVVHIGFPEISGAYSPMESLELTCRTWIVALRQVTRTVNGVPVMRSSSHGVG